MDEGVLKSDAGVTTKFVGARIAGVVSCLPNRLVTNHDFSGLLETKDIDDVVKMIGVRERYWANEDTTTGDLCVRAAKELLDGLQWDPSSVDAVVFLSQTPDYVLPATACVAQAALGLRSGCFALDVNLGCSGYPYALWLGMSLIASQTARRVLLLVGDTISKTVDRRDRSTALLFGDAGTATALESSGNDCSASFLMGTDGRGARNLIVPGSGFRKHQAKDDQRWEGKDLGCLYMDGGEVFNFTLRAVPRMVDECLAIAGFERTDYDGFLFHQANEFMLKHLTKKCKLTGMNTPINIDRYGNTSCASIPLLLTTDLRGRLLQSGTRLATFGFGVGYSWAACSLEMPKFDFVETIKL